jgi:hypothetical protein
MPKHISADAQRLREILAIAKRLAVEYFQLTGKPLGVTGEVAEYAAAEKLDLKLAPPRTPGYDALRGIERIQIKGRAHGKKTDSGQKMGRIRTDTPFDTVLLVLLDNATLEPREMWQASHEATIKRLAAPGWKARSRGVLSVPEFKAIAQRVWPVARILSQ